MSNKKNNNKNRNAKFKDKWILIVVFWTIIISGSISFLSDVLLKNVNILVAFIILIFIIMFGVIFDIIGVAVTAAEESPFHAMASKKIPEANIAIKLIRNADKVSNFCNDVIGDVCGIVSGSVGALIIGKFMLNFSNVNTTFVSALIGSLIAALTVGGKGFGKTMAIKNSNYIVKKVSKLIYLIKKG